MGGGADGWVTVAADFTFRDDLKPWLVGGHTNFWIVFKESEATVIGIFVALSWEKVLSEFFLASFNATVVPGASVTFTFWVGCQNWMGLSWMFGTTFHVVDSVFYSWFSGEGSRGGGGHGIIRWATLVSSLLGRPVLVGLLVFLDEWQCQGLGQ